jgi:two-component system, chemotaxis family, chemotaxis protein CheY
MLQFLVVDDDPACRRLVEQYLLPFGQCDLAHDGYEGLAAFRMALDRKQPYDLVCLDIMMPGTDGHDVLDALRKTEREQGIFGSDGVKVIMATALMDSKHCIRAFQEGCESYLTKPIKEQALQKQVELLLGKLPSAGESSKTSEVSALEVETANQAKSECSNQAARGHYLVVDDDRLCRVLLADILEPYGQCDFAYDGSEAIEAVRLALEDETPYDLICLDIMMPGVSGHDALKAIREVEAEHGVGGSDGVKVIMTTALRDSKHCIQSFREGCESYVTKPVTETELIAQMQQLGLLSAETACQ